MIPPTNPKKQALMPSGALRKALRAAGHHLSVIVQVGKEGVTPAGLAQLSEALLAHELVKVKVGTESPHDRFEAAALLAAAPDTNVAQVLGRTLLVYRKHPVEPRFEAGPPVRALPAPEVRRNPRRNVARRPGRTTAQGPERTLDRATPRSAAREGARRSTERSERTSAGRPGRRPDERPTGRRPAKRPPKGPPKGPDARQGKRPARRPPLPRR